MNVHYRQATADDASALGLLAAELVRQHHELDPARFLAPPPDVERGYGRWLSREAQREGAAVWVAIEDGAVVGYAYATIEERDWNELLDAHGKLHDILVASSARRRGVARGLLEHMRTFLAERGCPRVVLSTATENRAAQALFASMGFRPTMVEMTWNVEGPARA